MNTRAMADFPLSRALPRGISLRVAALGMVAAMAATFAAGQSSGMVTVQLAKVTPRLEAYAQVEPIRTLPVNAAEVGTLSGLRVVPGTHVRAGERLARLRGPVVRALLVQDEANLRSARAQMGAAEKTLAIERGQLRAHLGTRAMVHQAEGAVAKARAAFDDAQSSLAAARQMAEIAAPADATVLAVNAANGQLVSAGQPVVTLQPANALWLQAIYYGSDLDAIHVGMKGEFSPANGGAPIAVRVCAVPGVMGPDGGERIAMTPAGAGKAWLNGQFGKVSLEEPVRELVAVPTRALILNQGKWWVMVHTAHGDRAQQVVPGPTQGWNTFVKQGLSPGAEVIVSNAYLLFHASISEHFQIPD